MKPLLRVLCAIAIGSAVAYLWEFLNAEIVGYLALRTFSDHWPLWAHIALPALLFLGITAITYWALMLALRGLWSAAVWASFIEYSFLVLYAHLKVDTGTGELVFSGTLVFVAVISGLVALRLGRRYPNY